ncbi:chemotaxis protein CheD [Halonatronum saccharophilum]|uniref:chemotaxis protein CheD n=1 Tax=Halonatronum saccharophilum TaxID=150060 RepID=UPI0004815CF3|nr:hypothetical protein [Halonatronum saccharophilum]
MGKCCLDARDLLMAEMKLKGANIRFLEAKVFGGGKVVNINYNDVAGSNIYFAKEYLKKFNIPIIAKDIGNDYGRKIYLCSGGRVYLQKIKNYQGVYYNEK